MDGRPVLRSRAGIGAAVLAFLYGCTVFPQQPDRSRFFVLAPLEHHGPARERVRTFSLGIGPLTFPRHLDRSEMVTRLGPHEVRPATFDYWSGSLAKQFEAALSQNLQMLTGADPVQGFPWYAGARPDRVVEVDVREFERHGDGEVRLEAHWRIRDGREGSLLRSGNSRLNRPAENADPASAAAALSVLLGDFSRELAAALDAETGKRLSGFQP